MTDLKEALETMRDMVAARIRMLQEGVTFYDEEKKAFYLREYALKLRDLDRQILSLRLLTATAPVDGDKAPLP